MGSDTKKWLKQYGEKLLKEVGITKNQNVLDFGRSLGFRPTHLTRRKLKVVDYVE